MPRILLISDVLPTKKHTTGIVLDQFFARLPHNYELMTYNIQSDGLPTYEVSRLITGKMRWARKPAETWLVPKYFRGIFEKFSAHDSTLISKDILREISRQKPDLVFVVLQGQTMFRIAIQLYKHGIEFSTFNWDPLSWWLHHNKAPRSNLKLLEEILPALNSGGVHILPNPNFADYLRLRSENHVVLNLCHEKFESLNEESERLLRVCFSGQSYASKEINFFIKTLENLEWMVDDFEIELHVFGNSYLGNSKNIIHHGWVDPTKLIQRLSFFDCALLPYPSEDEFKEVTKYSFPSKFSTYIAANLPVLYIGPETNPFSELQKQSMFTLSLNDINRLIMGLKNFKYDRKKYTQVIPHLFDSEFSVSAQTSVVQKFLDLQSIHFSVESSSLMGNIRRNSREGQEFQYPAISISLSNRFYKWHLLVRHIPKYVILKVLNIIKRIAKDRNKVLGAFIGFIYFLISTLFSSFKS